MFDSTTAPLQHEVEAADWATIPRNVWQTATAGQGTGQEKALLDDGWEPFAAYVTTLGPTVVLRRCMPRSVAEANDG